MKPVPPSTSRGAFTLIEILVVIAIIAILASLILSVSGFVQEKAGISRAQVEIKALETALENYKQDNGTYPAGDGSESSSLVLLDELNRKPASGTSGGKIYMADLGKMIPPIPGNPSASYAEKVAAARQLVDPFGNPYHYEFPGKPERSGEAFFDLWSQGKKNSADENKWIKNW
ncbi:MAG TPA: type II secretion system protein GspG [Chthoniobacterales bacterium]|jgi:prepilin-type N-terminal cleavage/methylation domain-containing protein